MSSSFMSQISLPHDTGIPKSERTFLPSVRFFAAPLRDKEGGLLLLGRGFGQELRAEASHVAKASIRQKSAIAQRRMLGRAERQLLGHTRSLEDVAEGPPTRMGGERLGVDRRQLQPQNRRERRSLDASVERSPTRKGRETGQGLTPGALCMSERFTRGEWAWTRITGLPSGCQRFEQSYPLYVGLGSA